MSYADATRWWIGYSQQRLEEIDLESVHQEARMLVANLGLGLPGNASPPHLFRALLSYWNEHRVSGIDATVLKALVAGSGDEVRLPDWRRRH